MTAAVRPRSILAARRRARPGWGFLALLVTGGACSAACSSDEASKADSTGQAGAAGRNATPSSGGSGGTEAERGGAGGASGTGGEIANTGAGAGGQPSGWSVGPVPQARGEDKPMTCEWIDDPNSCWRQLVSAAQACVQGGEGAFTPDRTACTFPGGARLELAKPMPVPDAGDKVIAVVDHRLLDAGGETCLDAKVVGIGRTALAVRGQPTVSFEAKGLTDYRLICGDGTSYSPSVDGTCPSAGARWLFDALPGYLASCDDSSKACTFELKDGKDRRAQPFAVCK